MGKGFQKRETISQPTHLLFGALSKLMQLGQHNPLLSDNLGSFLKVKLNCVTSVFVCGETIVLSPGNQSLGSMNSEVSVCK